jgi:hypothetical protein
MKGMQELADEAFRDILKKHGRPISLKECAEEEHGIRQTTSAPKLNSRSSGAVTVAAPQPLSGANVFRP